MVSVHPVPPKGTAPTKAFLAYSRPHCQSQQGRHKIGVKGEGEGEGSAAYCHIFILDLPVVFEAF